MAKNYEDLTFTDDFVFGKVMEDQELCREVLECLFGHSVGDLEVIQTQRQLQCTVDSKPIRLDVYTKDKNSIYNAEMQNLNHKTIDSLELPKRSRFYQSVMDTDYLEKGNSYRTLPEGNVLFLCTFDPFGLGLPRYVFQNRCDDVTDLTLKDETVKIFYNCTYDFSKEPSDPISKELMNLYRFIQTGKGKDTLTDKLEDAVRNARHNSIWKAEYMKELLHDDDMREEGRSEGARMRDRTLICKWLTKGKTIAEIAEDLDVTDAYVEEIIQELNISNQ